MMLFRAVHDDHPEPTTYEGAWGETGTTPATGDHTLPDHIAFLSPYALRWEVSFNQGDTWFPIGQTSHEVYVTLTTPTGQRLESMYYIAVTSAAGETTPFGA